MDKFPNTPPFISVVIVTYNYEKYLGRSLNACRRQTFKNFEIVVVDNGSTDGSAELIGRFIQDNPGLTVKSIRIGENRGLPRGRNAGLDAASGTYVLFNDADDWMDENCLALLAQRAMETDADKIIGLERYCHENGRVSPGTHVSDSQVKWLYNRLQASLYRRSIFVDNAIRWLDVWQEDYYINLNFNVSCKTIAVVPVVVYNYFIHNSLFVSNISGQREKMKAVLAQSCDFTLKALGKLTDAHDRSIVEYQMIKFYYLILLSYNRINSAAAAIENYVSLNAIFLERFPHYLQNENIKLFNNRLDRFKGRSLMLLLTSLEKLRLMKSLVLANVLQSRIRKWSK